MIFDIPERHNDLCQGYLEVIYNIQDELYNRFNTPITSMFSAGEHLACKKIMDVLDELKQSE